MSNDQPLMIARLLLRHLSTVFTMVMLLSQSWTALYWLVATVPCAEASKPTRTFYAQQNLPFEMTFNLPNDPNVVSLFIVHDRRLGETPEDVMAIQKGTLKNDVTFDEFFQNRFWPVESEGKVVKATIQTLSRSDAGTYICKDNGDKEYGDCGFNLYVIESPRPPKLVVSDVPVAGKKLTITCPHYSSTSPYNHGLKHEVKWYDAYGKEIGILPSDKYSINSEMELVINEVEKTDRDLNITCITADLLPNRSQMIYSDPSDLLILDPHYSPTEIIFTPNISSISRKLKENLHVRCDADCNPVCQMKWLFQGFFIKAPGSLVREVPGPTIIFNQSVSRLLRGYHVCQARNIHGEMKRGFDLEVYYIEKPAIYINYPEFQRELTLKGLTQFESFENVTLKVNCIVDALPDVIMSLKLDNKVLLSRPATIIGERLSWEAWRGYFQVIEFTLNSTQCGQNRELVCEAENVMGLTSAKTALIITCPASIVSIPGLELKPDYFYDVNQMLEFSFVIRSMPRPEVLNVTSKLKGVMRLEEISKHVELKDEGSYENANHLTMYKFICKRLLDPLDSGTVFTINFNTSNSGVMPFNFKVHVSGLTSVLFYTHAKSPPTTRAPTQRVQFTTGEPYKKNHDFSSATVLAVVFVVTFVSAAVAFTIFLFREKKPVPEDVQVADENFDVGLKQPVELLKPSPSGYSMESKIE